MHEGIPVAIDNLDACINFYTEVLGLELLLRPKTLDKCGPGAWLGDEDDTVQFHLMTNDNTLISGKGAQIEPTVSHTALEIMDIGALRDRLNLLKI
jgi:catechol 2,3-dioxygenase-like lactoylglutathione lyase family enzyme